MTIVRIALACALTVAFAPFAGAAEEQEVTLVGEPVDIQCYMAGRSGEGHAQCAKSCAENGNPIGFVAADDEGKETLYLVLGSDGKSAKDVMLEHMGLEVEATGTVSEKNGLKVLTVASVAEPEPEDDDFAWLPTEGVGGASMQNE